MTAATRAPVGEPDLDERPPPPPQPPSSRPTRRRWSRRLLIGANIAVALCMVAAAGTYGYTKWRYAQIDKVALARGKATDPNAVLVDQAAGGAMNVLLVGSDSRANNQGQDAKAYGSATDVVGQRSDVMIILHIDPRTTTASMLSIPRDLYVPIAGTNKSDKLNAAYAMQDKTIDGASRLIRTIRSSLGIDINHYVQVDFQGFKGIVNAVGGVEVYFTAPARDSWSGLRIKDTGCNHLDGEASLALVRSRHYEYYDLSTRKWRDDTANDLYRIQRQQDFIRRVLRKAIDRGATNPAVLNQLVGSTVGNLTIDSALKPQDMVNLGKRFKSLSPDQVGGATLPVYEAKASDGQYILKLKEPEATRFLTAFNGKPPPYAPQVGPAGPAGTLVPSAVRVRVLNGASIDGKASAVAGDLQSAGFVNTGIGSATNRYARTTVLYAKGQLPKAQLLQEYLSSGATLESSPTMTGTDLILVIGSDFGTLVTPGGHAAPDAVAPATTAPSSVAPSSSVTVTTLPLKGIDPNQTC